MDKKFNSTNLEVELRKWTDLEGDADEPEAGELHVEDVLVQGGHLVKEDTCLEANFSLRFGLIL